MFPASGSCDFSCVLEAVGTPPFVVLGVVAQGFVEVDFNKYFARWGFNISESSDFKDISKVLVA